MARARKPKIDTRGPLQRILDRDRAANDAAPVVNEFAARHGDYETHLKRQVNRGGTPIARWRKAGLISDSQQAAIEHCLRLWDCIGVSGGLVANLDRTVFGCPGDGHSREVEARDDLHRMKGYVGERYWSVFENVVRFDEPAGAAGSRIQGPTRENETRARYCVLFVADIIATKERLSY
jgi:hypothetical protein